MASEKNVYLFGEDIRKLDRFDKIWVNINLIHIQYAKVHGNPKRRVESQILLYVLNNMQINKDHIDPRYVKMTVRDVLIAFEDNVDNAFKTAFLKY